MLGAGAVDFLAKSEINEAHVARAIRYGLAQRQSWLTLRSSEDRHRVLMQNSAQGLWLFEFAPPISLLAPHEEQVHDIIQRARMVECNDVNAQMYGFVRAAQMQGLWLRNVMGDGGAETTAFLRKFIDANYLLRDAELMERDRYGDPKHFLCNVTGIIEDGYLVGAWGAQSDITQTRKSETKQARLAAIVEASDDAILAQR